jgi:hypothetical protein
MHLQARNIRRNRGKLWFVSPAQNRRFEVLLAGIVSIVVTLLAAFAFSAKPAACGAQSNPVDAPQSIYATNPDDPWNRIFYSLFTRQVEARLSSDFPEGAPFGDLDAMRHLQVSTRLFERFETGDRAIDPLYPSFINLKGARQVLEEPRYSLLVAALSDAEKESAPRSAVARALMQSDLWAAFDILYRMDDPRAAEDSTLRHVRVLLAKLAQLIQKTALTEAEIEALPNNYEAAATRFAIPNFFEASSGWLEMQWFPQREHDAAADFRRFTRVFIKPSRPSQRTQKFLDSLLKAEDPSMILDGVALVTQLLLIDSRGEIVPSALTSEVQVRLFNHDGNTSRIASVRIFEVSRKEFVNQPESGGLLEEGEHASFYLPSAGNDYQFASPVFAVNMNSPGLTGPPVLVSLRTRCGFCHGPDLTGVRTFSIVRPPHAPSVKLLRPASYTEADEDITRKRSRPDWKVLRQYLDGPPFPAANP